LGCLLFGNPTLTGMFIMLGWVGYRQPQPTAIYKIPPFQLQIIAQGNEKPLLDLPNYG